MISLWVVRCIIWLAIRKYYFPEHVLGKSNQSRIKLRKFFLSLKRSFIKAIEKFFTFSSWHLGGWENLRCSVIIFLPPPPPTSFFCVKMRVCKQRNICNLLICWILKWSFVYYLIPNIFFVSDSRWKQWWWGTGHPNILVYLSGNDSCLLRNLIEAIR